MKIIISPAKQMSRIAEYPEPRTSPVFLEQADRLREYLRSLSFERLKALLACNDKIARLNYERYQNMNLRASSGCANAAILSYDGIQYKYMAPQVFETAYFDWVQEHVRILSGFYGILRPLDGIVPYRLEMQAKPGADFCRDLYGYWGGLLCGELLSGEGDFPLVINLASQEYCRAVEPFLPPSVRYLTCRFGELESGEVREKGVYVKMARGEMVRYLAENRAAGNERDLRNLMEGFNRLGFQYASPLSDGNTLVFLMQPVSGKGARR